jgi:hypothetical protein
VILTQDDRKPNPATAPVFTVGETVHHITGSGRSFRIAIVTSNGGTRIGIRYVVGGKDMRVWPWPRFFAMFPTFWSQYEK